MPLADFRLDADYAGRMINKGSNEVFTILRGNTEYAGVYLRLVQVHPFATNCIASSQRSADISALVDGTACLGSQAACSVQKDLWGNSVRHIVRNANQNVRIRD